MRIVFCGIVGRYPWGGVTWCSLMYLLGLRRLGHDVYYLEDTCEANFDPVENTVAEKPDYALGYINDALAPFGFGDRWCYVDYTGRHHGMSQERCRSICESADLFIVLSGGCWVWRDHYRKIPVKVFIDSDPAFTQLAIDNAMKTAHLKESSKWYVDFFKTYDHLFTFGGNIGKPSCTVPTCDLPWKHTWQPICTDLWSPVNRIMPSREKWTTVMTWTIESFADIGGNKDEEFLKVIDLPSRWRNANSPVLELAINGPRDLLQRYGWGAVEALPISSDPWRYHSYLASSRGEFSVAKHTYVATRSGWFSDRTECYLALGKPAVVQDTGFRTLIPTGSGLLAWQNPDEAYEALLKVEMDYKLHCYAARDLALEHFNAKKVLKTLLNSI